MIVNIGSVSQAFQKAHSALLDRRGFPMGANHYEVLMRWWHEDYGIKIIPDRNWGRFGELEFDNEEAMTLFLLKWS